VIAGAILLALPFGLAVGLSLGLVGGGGSILAVPILVYVLGEDVKDATTASLLIVGVTALAGAVDHARGGRVRVRTALPFGAAGGLGAFAGTALNRGASPETILFLFAIVLLAAAFGMVRRKDNYGRFETAARGRALWLEVIPTGLGVGVLTGFFGVGGGFVIVPALALLLGLPITVAVGTSLLVIALTSTAALAAHLTTGGLHWGVAGAFTAAGVAGAIAGSRLGERVSSRRLREGFAVLVVAVAALLLVENASMLA
jgi:uncharacterized membrane protein YfcA